MIIACAGEKLQPFLQTLKETFARTGEAAALKWQNIDLEKRIITINDAEKNSNPRQVEISEKLVKMLQRIPKSSDLVFGENAKKRMRKLFHWIRTRLAYRNRTCESNRFTFTVFDTGEQPCFIIQQRTLF